MEKNLLYKRASLLAIITIVYNLVEGIVSVFFGAADETLSLFGFGIDSFVEVLSGIGIWNMVRRMKNDPDADSGPFEKRALQITGISFYILSAGLIITAAINIYHGHKPETTFWGIVIALISIFTMWALIHFKVKVGKELDSETILEDANCTRTCLYLSFILLLASAGYELTGIGGIDSIGAILIAVFSFREGRESFEKAEDLPSG
ncbi:MAG: cation transporter [Desulfobacteraceae bacterium]|jgi:divalent metal cation (Fe/Co/Zn/Cd) transporter